MSTPTSRTLEYCRKQGWTAEVVERWNSWSKTRKDLFNGLDIVALDEQSGVLGIQCTSDSNVSARVVKLTTEPKLLRWVERGNRLEVWGWGKKGAKGKAKRWTLRVVSLHSEMWNGKNDPVPAG